MNETKQHPFPICEENNKYAIAGRKILPFLILQTKIEEPITYGNLKNELDRLVGFNLPPISLGYPLGNIGYTINILNSHYWNKEPIPPIEALVITKKDRIPGCGIYGLIQDYDQLMTSRGYDGLKIGHLGSKKDLSEQKEIFEEIYGRIYRFNWDEVWELLIKVLRRNGEHETLIDLEEYKERLNYLPIPSSELDKKNKKKKKTSNRATRESQAHEKLKNFIANRPKKFPKSILDELNLTPSSLPKIGAIEHPLKSGDWLDVLFEKDSLALAVEVKSIHSSKGDITRGLYQCIKYRSVLKAQQKVEGKSTKIIDAVLILEGRLTLEKQKRISKLFDILVCERFKYPK